MWSHPVVLRVGVSLIDYLLSRCHLFPRTGTMAEHTKGVPIKLRTRLNFVRHIGLDDALVAGLFGQRLDGFATWRSRA